MFRIVEARDAYYAPDGSKLIVNLGNQVLIVEV